MPRVKVALATVWLGDKFQERIETFLSSISLIPRKYDDFELDLLIRAQSYPRDWVSKFEQSGEVFETSESISRSGWKRSRNELLERALIGTSDWIYMVDDDFIFHKPDRFWEIFKYLTLLPDDYGLAILKHTKSDGIYHRSTFAKETEWMSHGLVLPTVHWRHWLKDYQSYSTIEEDQWMSVLAQLKGYPLVRLFQPGIVEHHDYGKSLST